MKDPDDNFRFAAVAMVFGFVALACAFVSTVALWDGATALRKIAEHFSP